MQIASIAFEIHKNILYRNTTSGGTEIIKDKAKSNKCIYRSYDVGMCICSEYPTRKSELLR